MKIIIGCRYQECKAYVKDNKIQDFIILGHAKRLHGLKDVDLIFMPYWYRRGDYIELSMLLESLRFCNSIKSEKHLSKDDV